eukprot:jgi/Ulvmu1/1330/UM011_0058.1
MAEVHFMGQILGGTGFPNTGLICKWGLEASEDTWDVLEGFTQGQTHTNWARDGGKAVWAHPIDVHYQCMGLSGWPKLHFQVWSVDSHGRTDICGYGVMSCPTTPGMSEMECPLWLPEGTAMERFSAFFVGGRPRLLDESVAYSGTDRFRLNTVCSGSVHVRIGCLLRDFAQNGVSTS